MPKTYAEIIAKEIHQAGYSYSKTQAVVNGQEVWIIDALKDGKRYVCQAETELTAFMELQGMFRRDD